MNSLLGAFTRNPGAKWNAIFAIGGVGLAAMDKEQSPEDKRRTVTSEVFNGLAQLSAGNSFLKGTAYSLGIMALFNADKIAKGYVELSRLGIQDRATLAQPFSQSGIGPSMSYSQLQHAKGLMETAYGYYDGNPARSFAAMHSR